MSGLLAGKVWQSNLDAHLKPLAAALADIGNDDGTSIHPSVDYMAWLLGNNVRSVQRGIRELKTLGVLAVVKNGCGGRNLTVHYRLIEGNLPKRSTWQELRAEKGKGDNMPPFPSVKGDTGGMERVTSTAERVTPVSPDPLVTVSSNREIKIPRAYKLQPIAVFGIDDVKDPTVFVDTGILELMVDLHPDLRFHDYFRKWWLSRKANGGIGRRPRKAAPLGDYTADIEAFFQNCADRVGDGSNGNGHKKNSDDRPMWMASKK